MNINSIIFQYAAVGDYLFLIMVVVASVIQMITQNKKKNALQKLVQKKKEQNNGQTTDVMERRPETMTGYDTPVDNIFDSIERILVPELEDGQHVWGDDYPETEYEKKNANDLAVNSNNSDVNNTEEKITRNVEGKQAELIPQKSLTDIPARRYRSGIRDGFSLRKAVVYSEILNRKYT